MVNLLHMVIIWRLDGGAGKKEMQSMDMEALLNDFVTRGMLESHSKLTQQRSDGRLALQ